MSKRKGIQSCEDLREDLECPVCLSIPKKGPIFQCESGHIHCEACHSGLRECPICRSPVGNTRCLAIEKVIAKLPTKCRFTEFGCMEEEKLPEEMLKHEKNCYFRLVNCVADTCNEKIPMPDIFDHCKLKHNYTHKIAGNHLNRPFRQDKERALSTQAVWFMSTKKHTFVVTKQTDDQNLFQFFAFILGSQNDIDEEAYSFAIEVKSRRSVCT